MDRFDQLLGHLAASVAKGAAAIEYIKKIDETLYTWHAFPLPRFGKTCSNPAEQANSGLLSIREFAPLKCLVEIWSRFVLVANTELLEDVQTIQIANLYIQ